MALVAWNVDDGTKRNLWQNPTSLPFFSYPIAPSWRVVAGGQINQTLVADGNSTTCGPQFIFQGLRMYDSPVAWIPSYAYREKEYKYAVPINFVQNTINPPSILLQTQNQIVNNFAFKLRRISIAWHAGPTNTAPAQTLGIRLYDWQNRSLMSDFVNAQFLDFNGRNATGAFVLGAHANFPSWPLMYPVNGQIKFDLTDMNATVAGFISDVQGTILFEGVNLIPCDRNAPGAIVPDDGRMMLYGGAVKYPLPYIYTGNTFNYALAKATFTSSQRFGVAVDGDSDFWMTCVHNVKNTSVIPPT